MSRYIILITYECLLFDNTKQVNYFEESGRPLYEYSPLFIYIFEYDRVT